MLGLERTPGECASYDHHPDDQNGAHVQNHPQEHHDKFSCASLY